MSVETFWSGVWFSYKKDLKMGCKSQSWKHRPVINLTCLWNPPLSNFVDWLIISNQPITKVGQWRILAADHVGHSYTVPTGNFS
jgi:hypothetical protein